MSRMSRMSVIVASVLISLTVLSGCGAEADPVPATQASSEEPSSESTVEPSEAAEPEFDPASAALTGDPFCGDLDVTAAEELLGLDSSQLALTSERIVGKKYKNPMGESTKATSNTCFYADAEGVAFLNVAVRPDSSATDVESLLKTSAGYVGAEGQSDKCAVEAETAYGVPGGVVLCTGVNFDSTKGRAKVEVLGLVGGSNFFCEAGLAQGSTPEQLEQPVRDFCAGVLQKLAVG